MRVFVTGATGFLGGRLAGLLRHRGDEVVALVRSPGRANALAERGCELVVGDLGGIPTESLSGCDLVVHAAAVYKVGIAPAEAAAMRKANVAGTERLIDAAVRAGVPRILHVSTVNVFGDTHDAIVDESYIRDLSSGFLSTYDETKYRAHELATERAVAGAPVVIAMPGGIYGPGDTSQLGGQIKEAMTGKLRYVSFPTLGLNAGYVDDIAAGLLLIAERGTLGESYVIGGEITTMRGIIDAAATAAGRKPPRLTMPTRVVKAVAPLAPLVGPALGLPADLHEAIRASDGVTYWATDAKARRELGYESRSLAQGMTDLAITQGS
jgi:dihydroflavonol-4-reductase